MSSFAVTVERIAEIKPIAGADKIEIAVLDGMNFQMVVGKGQFSAGDLGVYFPLDAVLPDNVLKAIGLYGMLSSRKHNRVKTKKFLGEISQGVIATIHSLDAWLTGGIPGVGDDLTKALSVFKYEPQEYASKHPGRNMPVEVTIYDIEGAQKHKRVVAHLMDKLVQVTEKLEGANFAAILYNINDWESREFKVCSHRRELTRPDDYPAHDCHLIADKYKLEDKMLEIMTEMILIDRQEIHANGPAFYNPSYITIRGEGIGPKWQKNIYKLDQLKLYCFELEVNGKPLQPLLARYFLGSVAGLPVVPSLHVGRLDKYLDGRTIVEASHGKSVLNSATLREGIVIRPLDEMTIPRFGRVILKQRDPIYLAQF